MTALRFGLASLSTWRVTHLLAEEDGPWDAVVRLRVGLGPSQLGELMDCFYCLSLWVAAPATLAVTRRRREAPLVWLALSGAACLLERASGGADLDRKGAPDVLWPEAKVAPAGEAAGGEPGRTVAPTRGAAAPGSR